MAVKVEAGFKAVHEQMSKLVIRQERRDAQAAE